MTLDITVEELENGFKFKDPALEMKVVAAGDNYQMLWTTEGGTSVHPLPTVKDKQQAYNFFRSQISCYWGGYVSPFFEMNNKERIEELFKPLAKYQ